MPIIALMTDFGTSDYYVAAMKGVILQINPKVTLVDISHDIGSQDLYHGAFVLRHSFPCFPPGTIFVAVVDPGVGTARRILAGRYSDRFVLTPDNGLVTLLHRDAELQEVRVVDNRRFFAASLSNTFHGRDIFAPVAAHLSKGVAIAELGPTATQIEILDLPKPRVNPDGTIDGQVTWTDRFGNLVTNISERDLSRVRTPRHQLEVFLGQRSLGPLRVTYAEVPAGAPLALIGSSQMLEIAVNSGNAQAVLGAKRGDGVTVR